MISVDTNVIIRFLVRDDESQYRKSRRLFEEQEIFVCDTVIIESEWVLRFAYKFTPDAICEAFLQLFGLANVHTANPQVVHQAIQWHSRGMDFSDALHLASSQHCHGMKSFDKDFVKSSKNLSSCPVSLP